MSGIHEWTATELGNALRRRELSAVEVVTAFIERIDSSALRDRIFVTLTPERAVAAARRADDADSRAPILWGIPHAEKDLVNRAGVATRLGSKAMRDNVATSSDRIVETLDLAGAISLGKTSTPEFGLHAYTRSDLHDPTPTPYDVGRNAGGSSGGAAAAVSARLLPFAVGSDGGGSIRIPASATGLVGLKPTRGLVPGGDGLGQVAGFAVAGPIARTAEDAALVFEALLDRERHRGVVPHDTSLRAPDPADVRGTALRGVERLRIGVTTVSPWREWCDIRLEPPASDALEVATEHLEAVGHRVEPFDWSPSAEFPEAFRVIWRSGIAAAEMSADQLAQLEPITAQIREAGARLSAADVVRAVSTLNAFERSTVRAFGDYDAVLIPGMAMTPRPHDWYDESDMERNFTQQVQYTPYTSFVNAVGLPAISLPVIETADGLPMSVQVVGRPGGESVLLGIAAQLQRRLRWHERMPPEYPVSR